MAMPKSEIDAHYLERAGRPNVTKAHVGDSTTYLFFKRALDLFGAVVGLVLSSPLFLIISLLYLFGGNKGPIFFKQKRTGQYGEIFYIYKFRSMVVNAEEQLKSNKLLYKKYLDNSYKLEPEEDPRITKIGCFLRKTSLDELPQFINVLKGEMSLVGPRPVVSEELKEYGDQVDKFLSAKPGLTGYWQACGRSEIEYPERCNVELYYVDNKSFLFDIKLIIKTFIAVIMKKGAY
ncbi:sugar transferase [Sporolactobacillus spathodeae]|uniref:Lipopolysaccharide/colanic/teichoic acid biosynthesis glycosyltransferase n=1 Tax=Sporolactobacillus spathodeae TaxID=1465502 RepID=A0ABS2Q8M7_9BACL|nr:sugar transferase [Sporolactobacillus spathodeae]MBM7657795.1 lipopolysaccharide/colanic/teichoic acid biosynthesis glycosyltransferase [Sporolactobacillus spathodeae]